MSLAEKLAAFVQGLPDFEFHAIDFGYNGHMGAIIIDGILQSGISYDTVVRPRVEKIRADFPSQTTSEFLAFYCCKLFSRVPAISWAEDRTYPGCDGIPGERGCRNRR